MTKGRKAVMLDVDGTLTESFTSPPIVLAGADAGIAHLRQRGYALAVGTNQAGPLWRAVTKQVRYPSAEEVGRHLGAVAQTLGLLDVPWFIATYDARTVSIVGDEETRQHAQQAATAIRSVLLAQHPTMRVRTSSDPRWRKPDVGMLQAAAGDLGVEHDVANALAYVGDMESDREAARRMGMIYVEAENWRGGAFDPWPPTPVAALTITSVGLDIVGTLAVDGIPIVHGAVGGLLNRAAANGQRALFVAAHRPAATLHALGLEGPTFDQEVAYLAEVGHKAGLRHVPWLLATHPGPVAGAPDDYVTTVAIQAAQRLTVALKSRLQNPSVLCWGEPHLVPPQPGLLDLAGDLHNWPWGQMAYITHDPALQQACHKLGVTPVHAAAWLAGTVVLS